MRYLDIFVSTAVTVILVLAMPMRDQSVSARLVVFAAIIILVPSLVCAARFAILRMSQHRDGKEARKP